VADGTSAIGHFGTKGGEVLYLALEDNERRMQRRLKRMLQGQNAPAGLWLQYEWPPLDRGGLDALREWLDAHPDVQLVVIDTLEHIRPRRRAVQNGLYADDYASVRDLLRLASDRQIAIVAITHLRKAPAEDPFDEVSGSTGLTGGVDNIIVMKPNQGLMDLHRRGREYEDDSPIALKGERETLLWTWQGKAEDAHRSESRKKVLAVLREHGPLSPLELTEHTDLTRTNVRQLLRRMLDEVPPPIAQDGDKYRLV
jgi:hypothetical protein